MGDPLRYPEIRSQRFLYAHKHLPSSVLDDDDYELFVVHGFATT